MINAKNSFNENGFLLFSDVFDSQQLSLLKTLARSFHEQWIADNDEFYQIRAINSAGLSSPRYLSVDQRMSLFHFVASEQIVSMLRPIFMGDFAFMNTQLFFDPVQREQRNYWHRDVQYTGLSIVEQQKVIHADQVLHLRIPLRPDNGLEIVAGSHKRWDTKEEFAVRLEQGEHHSAEDLSVSTIVKPAVGDALLFSAHAIHRGLYGQDRLVLDLLYCDTKPDLLAHVDTKNLPADEELEQLSNPWLFRRLD